MFYIPNLLYPLPFVGQYNGELLPLVFNPRLQLQQSIVRITPQLGLQSVATRLDWSVFSFFSFSFSLCSRVFTTSHCLGYFSFSPAPPSPYYYTTEYTGSPGASSVTTNDSYQGSVSSRSSSSQGHYRHPSSSSSTSSSSHNQAAVYDHSQYDGRTNKRQRVAVPVDPTGHLQPHWMSSANQSQAHSDFTAGMYHQHPHPQMQMSYSSPVSATGRHSGGGGYATTATATTSLTHSQASIATAPSTAPARRHASPTQTGPQKAHGGCQEGEEEEEHFEHGPTELPPRTFAGHSKYNQPKKPGKIPGSAMDYVRLLLIIEC